MCFAFRFYRQPISDTSPELYGRMDNKNAKFNNVGNDVGDSLLHMIIGCEAVSRVATRLSLSGVHSENVLPLILSLFTDETYAHYSTCVA